MSLPGETLDTVLVGGEWRVVGAVSAEELEELEELERAHEAGDLRAESRLELLRKGRPGDRRPAPTPASYWHNVAGNGGIFQV